MPLTTGVCSSMRAATVVFGRPDLSIPPCANDKAYFALNALFCYLQET